MYCRNGLVIKRACQKMKMTLQVFSMGAQTQEGGRGGMRGRIKVTSCGKRRRGAHGNKKNKMVGDRQANILIC